MRKVHGTRPLSRNRLGIRAESPKCRRSAAALNRPRIRTTRLRRRLPARNAIGRPASRTRHSSLTSRPSIEQQMNNDIPHSAAGSYGRRWYARLSGAQNLTLSPVHRAVAGPAPRLAIAAGRFVAATAVIALHPAPKIDRKLRYLKQNCATAQTRRIDGLIRATTADASNSWTPAVPRISAQRQGE